MIDWLEDWYTCTRCELHQFRRKVCVGQGDIPADLLFIGIGPGRSEDLRGITFIGKSGRILRTGIKRAAQLAGLEKAPTSFITNLLACHPTDAIRGPNLDPEPHQVTACWPRVEEIEIRVKPKAVILLGNEVKNYYWRRFPEAFNLRHPSFIVHQGGIQTPEYRSFVRGLVEIFRSISSKKPRRIFSRRKKR